MSLDVAIVGGEVKVHEGSAAEMIFPSRRPVLISWKPTWQEKRATP